MCVPLCVEALGCPLPLLFSLAIAYTMIVTMTMTMMSTGTKVAAVRPMASPTTLCPVPSVEALVWVTGDEFIATIFTRLLGI